MSCAASAKKVLAHSCLPLLAAVMMFCTFTFGQSDAKPKQPKQSGKKAQTATPGEEKKADAPQTGAEKSKPAVAEESDQEETKGPWHGLTWRLIGPFRGGRVLAVSGVVGDARTYYFGGVGGGVWKTTDGGLTWRPMTDKVKDMAPSIGAIAVAP